MLRAPGYCLLGMLEGLGLRAVRDALPDNPVSETEPKSDAISRYSHGYASRQHKSVSLVRLSWPWPSRT